MNNTQRLKPSAMYYLCLFVFAALPAVAYANIPLPSLFGYGAPFFLSWRTLGVVFVAIVCVEATIIHLGTRIKWSECLKPVLLANLATSVLGLLTAYTFGILIFLGVAYWALSKLERYVNIPWYWAVPLVLLPIGSIIAWVALSWPYGRGAMNWAMYCSLIPAYLLTVIVEVYIVFKWLQAKRMGRFVLLGNGASYLLLAGLMLVFSYSQRDNPLITLSYLRMMASGEVQSNRKEKAVELVDIMHEVFTESKNSDLDYLLYSELSVAQQLAERGHYDEAERILARAKTCREADPYKEMLSKDLFLKVEELLTEELKPPVDK